MALRTVSPGVMAVGALAALGTGLSIAGTLLNIDPFWLQVAIGALILIAVGLDQLLVRPARASVKGTA